MAIVPNSSIPETAADSALCEELWRRVVTKLRRTSPRIGVSVPNASVNGRYDNREPFWWTAGFWPGLLWLAYRDERHEPFRELAEACERNLDAAIWGYDELHHDVGFMWSLTSVARYKLLKAEDSRRRAMLAASLLASRFNPRGSFLRAWNWENAGWVIIDCLMNLPLLYWASELIGDPRFKYIAMAHADTALQHQIRSDGSCRHIVSLDPSTGAFLEAIAGQGAGPDSAWARGAAWALYGMTLSFRYTGEPRYLAAAERVAEFFLSNLPAETVPYWDFRVPITPETPRDSSAGACAASGLLELAALVPRERKGFYRRSAVRLLTALNELCGAWDRDEEGLLLMGTGHKPANNTVNVPLIYGDYFFVEALAKLRGRTQTFW